MSRSRSTALFLRRWHRWVSVVVALPFLLTLGTGTVLLLRGQMDWIQPRAEKSTALVDANSPSLSLETLFLRVRALPEAKIRTWNDVKAIDIRPATGVARFRTKNGLEAQVDLYSGEVLRIAPRRSSFLIELHEGSFFGEGYRTGVLLPAALGLLFLLFSGLFLFFRGINRKTPSRSAARPSSFASKGIASL
jgi:uncharacterized iron-regulated membrane protein